MHLTELWERHRQHLTLRRRSSYTITYYAATYRALWAYFDTTTEVPEVEVVTLVQLRQFMLHLQERGLAEGGIDAHFRALRGVFGWAFKEELLPQDPTRRLERPSKPQRLQATLTPEEYRRMLEVAKKSDYKLRDIAVVVTLFDTGLRLSEIAGLCLLDVRLTEGYLRVIGKGNKERIVPLGLRSTETIDRWIRKAWKPRHLLVQELFLNRAGVALTRSGYSQLLADMAVRAEVLRAHAAPHAFRRAFGI